MYALLFAGGVGQRLWPISRKNSPKQFSPLMGEKSSLQLAVERLRRVISPENIFISTNLRYASLLTEQVPEIPKENFILEPVRRDLAAAVAFSFSRLHKQGITGPIYFQWADNFVRYDDRLLEAIDAGRELIVEDPNRIIFLGEVPRFASENLGYIEHGNEIGSVWNIPYYEFKSWAYRPSLDRSIQMVKAGNFLWNAGFFVTTVEFIVAQYKFLAPEITKVIDEILSYEGTPKADQKLNELYPTIPSMHFDESFLMRLQPTQAVLIKVNLGWSDPGSLYGLKEALQTSDESNVTQGDVVAVHVKDSLVINEEEHKTISVMGLNGIMIVNTPDALLIIDKDSVRNIKTLIDELEQKGKSHIL